MALSSISSLEAIDRAVDSTLATPLDLYSDSSRIEPARRVSRLPPIPTLPHAGPSRGPQRYFYVAIRRGHRTGVYSSWPEAERQIVKHPSPVFKTFSTRLAAEAYIAGWDGAGRHSLPASSPRILREHLAMNFPSSVPLPSSPNRPSYHSRLMSVGEDSVWSTDFAPRPQSTQRPASYRHSLVKVSSPLRVEVDETASARPNVRKTRSLIGAGGLLSPPASPEDKAHPPPLQSSVLDRDRPLKHRSMTETGTWSSGAHRQFPGAAMRNGVISPPPSPPILPENRRPLTKRTPSGLWADSKPITPSCLGPPALSPDLPVSDAPKFSRSSLKKTGVVMPVAAPRSPSSSSLNLTLSRKSSRSSLVSSPSLTSLHSVSSQSARPVRRKPSNLGSSQDRLASLAETTQQELKLNEEGLLALDSLSPPRAAFMRKSSSSSLSSMSSLTSAASSAPTSSLDTCGPIEEELIEPVIVKSHIQHDIQISCTKSDADADGSVESSSMKSGNGGKNGKKKGGLFKRLTKALKLEKKSVPGHEGGRRGSL